jgi:hypothetical protein
MYSELVNQPFMVSVFGSLQQVIVCILTLNLTLIFLKGNVPGGKKLEFAVLIKDTLARRDCENQYYHVYHSAYTLQTKRRMNVGDFVASCIWIDSIPHFIDSSQF